jgi:hypothetical protein
MSSADTRRNGQAKAGYPSAAALAMARAQKRLAEKYKDKPLAYRAAALEQRALDAIKQGKPELLPATRIDDLW